MILTILAWNIRPEDTLKFDGGARPAFARVEDAAAGRSDGGTRQPADAHAPETAESHRDWRSRVGWGCRIRPWAEIAK